MVKAQSAIEYLMTYGWMLLVVAVVGGLLFTFFSNQYVESISGFTGERFVVEDFGVNQDNELGLQVLHARSGEAFLTNVTVEGPDGVKYNDSFSGEGREFNAQDRFQVTVDGFNASESGYSYRVELVYDTDDLSNMVSSGEISGQLMMLD